MSQKWWGVVLGGSGGGIGSALTAFTPNPLPVKAFGFCCLLVSLVALNVGWYKPCRVRLGGRSCFSAKRRSVRRGGPYETLMRQPAPLVIPSWADAPLALLRRDGPCGLLAAWVVLRHFRKRPSSATLIKNAAHSNRHGTFAIGIACALAKAGLKVRFYTDDDPDEKPLERRLYRTAAKAGVAILPAVDVRTLVLSIGVGGLPIVFYKDGGTEYGHFSPLVGMRGRQLLLPHDDDGGMSVTKFNKVWADSDVCRQAIVAYAG